MADPAPRIRVVCPRCDGHRMVSFWRDELEYWQPCGCDGFVNVALPDLLQHPPQQGTLL